MKTLNSHQQAAVDAPESHVQVLAGAGTGKTEFLVRRALALAERSERVRLVTFSRRGARVLRSRLEDADASPDVVERIAIDTHHGLARELLRRHGARVGLAPGWTIIDRVEQKAIEGEAKDRLDLFDARLRRGNLLTFDQLLPAAVRLLEEHPEVATEEAEDLALTVDEAQDSDRLQWAMDLVLGRQSLTAVGDLAQRIYGWAGAQAFDQVLQGYARYELPTNYRSGLAVLSRANRLPIAGRIDLHPASKAQALRGWTATWTGESYDELIGHLLSRTDIRFEPESWAILSRTKYPLRRVADQLQAAGVAVRYPAGAAEQWESAEARALTDHLHVVANPHDSRHLARVLEQAGWSRAKLAEAEFGRSDPAHPCSLWDWCCATTPAGTPAANALRVISEIRGVPHCAMDATMVLYGFGLVKTADNIPLEMSVEDFLAWLADPDRDEPEGAPGCYLGTIHSAKGEEYQNVMVLGLEEGCLPAARWGTETRDEAERIEEERRVLYVAVTRARENLILASRTHKPNRRRGAEPEPTTASRFLSEIGGLPC